MDYQPVANQFENAVAQNALRLKMFIVYTSLNIFKFLLSHSVTCSFMAIDEIQKIGTIIF